MASAPSSDDDAHGSRGPLSKTGTKRCDSLEDVLEQIVDDYLKFNGYLTIHNVGFRRRPDHQDYDVGQDSVRSDIDVVGYDPNASGRNRVTVVSCKAWQGGFNATAKLAELRGEKPNPKRATWRLFREFWIPKWSQAFREAIFQRTGQTEFAYRIAATRLTGDADAWSSDPTIQTNLPGCSIGFLPLQEMWATMLAELTSTPAPSEIGRLAQLLKRGSPRQTSLRSRTHPRLALPPDSEAHLLRSSRLRSRRRTLRHPPSPQNPVSGIRFPVKRQLLLQGRSSQRLLKRSIAPASSSPRYTHTSPLGSTAMPSSLPSSLTRSLPSASSPPAENFCTSGCFPVGFVPT